MFGHDATKKCLFILLLIIFLCITFLCCGFNGAGGGEFQPVVTPYWLRHGINVLCVLQRNTGCSNQCITFRRHSLFRLNCTTELTCSTESTFTSFVNHFELYFRYSSVLTKLSFPTEIIFWTRFVALNVYIPYSIQCNVYVNCNN